ncbi:SDR family oxidoreductase [Sphingobium phenoxybenzoativorans]|uniref:SDR family oxidoreductase n=1 Tax=Sphingobium phenoxybenzoativorans TaxID=1592790 RepID=UPI000872308C|nr:SDR family oxidoreductase [Sphingobium phenoxybenzoativorans]
MARFFITGCSSGFGLATAELAARAGHDVYATVRNLSSAGPLEELRDGGLPIVIGKLDVTSAADVDAALADASARHPIDILVNNAGYEVVAPVEHLSDAQMLSQFDTNVFGVLRLIRSILPSMRARRQGRIINISSVVAHMSVAHRGAYCASKHALEGLTKSLWIELRPFGIDVISVAPGAFPTRFAANYVYPDGFDEQSPYWPFEMRLRNGMGPFIQDMMAGQTADDVARVVLEAATTANPPYQWIVGRDAELLIPLARSKDLAPLMEDWYADLGMIDLLRPSAS